jgi:hypothetical protein
MTTTVENMLQTGAVLNDKWVILELIGKGGMGEVYGVKFRQCPRFAIQMFCKSSIMVLTLSRKMEKIPPSNI